MECEHGIGVRIPDSYIPEHDFIEDVHENKKKTSYFKMTTSSTGNELKVVIWVSETPALLIHDHTAIHAC